LDTKESAGVPFKFEQVGLGLKPWFGRTWKGKGEYMLSRFAIAILATAILMSPAKAQTRGAAAGTRGIGVGPGVTGRAGLQGRGHQGHPLGRRSLLWPYPYFDYDYGYDYEQAPPPAQIVAVPASAPVTTPAAAPIEPLLIEWQGDHFVRMTLSEKAAADEQSGPDYSEKSAPRASVPGRGEAVQPLRELPPAVLVFRDGRKEEASSYTIMSGTIYSTADYWSSGSWTRKIQIADLDIPATLKLNEERGLKFVVPASPNEVVMRP
jgi:hypothetical protein